MDEEVQESFLTGEILRRQTSRFSTLRLRFKRTLPAWSTRYLLPSLILGAVILYYGPTLLFSNSGMAWSSKLQYDGPVTDSEEWERRATAVRDAFARVYGVYEREAFPKDEWRPFTHKGVQMMNGWGLSAVDSLDTMVLMKLHPQVNSTIHWISTLDFKHKHRSKHTPFFETTIRYLGGLLSAYHLTGDPVLLQKADELGETLLPAFNTPSKIPLFAIDSGNGNGILVDWNGGHSLLSEIASCQLEFKYLSHLTGKAEYFEKVDRITSILQRDQGKGGLWNTFWNVTSGKQVNDHLTVGSTADSAYEYLLKEFLLTGRSDERLLAMYKRAVFGAITQLVFLSPRRHLLYITDIRKGLIEGTFQHLSCFFPGLLALGVSAIPNWSQKERQLHEMVAHGLAESCWLMYKDMKSGLGPDQALFEPFSPNDVHESKFVVHYDKWVKNGGPSEGPLGLDRIPDPVDVDLPGFRHRDYMLADARYKLRPETIETIFIMWKTTRNPIWRERAWEIFQNLERSASFEGAYAVLKRVDDPAAGFEDSMPSFLFAETFKYLYLTFLDPKDDPWPLDRFVFNTEAHPLPVFSWTASEQSSWDAFRAQTRRELVL
ncbi:seven-hairpin glycosidase [Serendipita vermifera]|nr:seven-hairpin glycosidase [Serendipita vermifera]